MLTTTPVWMTSQPVYDLQDLNYQSRVVLVTLKK
jgi:hypothetical protein